MKRLALFWLLLGGSAAPAHYNMLLPQSASVKRGEEATIVYQWGHPFEHQLFAAPEPASVLIRKPDGNTVNVARVLVKVSQAKEPTTYRLHFTPQERGDYLLILSTPPIWMKEDEEFLQDTVKVVLHVQVQKGWDASAGQSFEMMPLTRPYGLEAGMVFQVQVLSEAKPLAGTHVEVERYNPTPPARLPPDEQMTRVVKTDTNGVATCTLTAPGWWCLTAQRDGGQRERDGKKYPVRQRTTFWVFVGE